MNQKTEAWLDREIASFLAGVGDADRTGIVNGVPWARCPDKTYRVDPTTAGIDLFLREILADCVEGSLARLAKRGAAVALLEQFPVKWRAVEPPGRFAQKKAIPVPPLGTFLDWQAMAPFGGVLVGSRTHIDDGPLTAIPVEAVVSEPTTVVPRYARVHRTPFAVRENGAVITREDLEALSLAVHGDRWVIKADDVICVEVWGNHGDDGHVEYRHDGWAFVSAAKFDAAVGASSEQWRGRGRTPYLSAVRDLMERRPTTF